MNGAIFFSSKYGSTKQYADWISKATGLPVFNMKDEDADPSIYDFLILGSPILYGKPYGLKNWINKNILKIEHKPIVLFTVSGAPAGEKLDGWIANSGIPTSLVSKMKHVALQGRQIPAELTWFDSVLLKIASIMSTNPKVRNAGYDFMNKTSIEPIVKFVEQFQTGKVQTL